MLPHAWYTICALIVIPIALSIAYCLPKKGGRRQPASRVCVRVLTPYPEPDWNQGKRWSPLGQPHPLTLVKVRWLGQGRSPKGAAQVKPPNGLIKGDLVPGSCESTHEVCECVCSGVMVLML